MLEYSMSDQKIAEEAFKFSFVRAGGPGGQHVNKVATAVLLKIQLGRSGLSEPVKARLRKLAGSRLNHADELSIFSDRYRSQLRNKEDALLRCNELLAEAQKTPKRRVPTRPSKTKSKARMESRKKQGRVKKLRRKPSLD
jgi:ribosome-associated protein